MKIDHILHFGHLRIIFYMVGLKYEYIFLLLEMERLYKFTLSHLNLRLVPNHFCKLYKVYFVKNH